jgi:two-component system, NarL family, response regulator LiaR
MVLGLMTIRIVLADDHVLLRQCLRALLEEEPDLEVVGEANTGHEAVDVVRRKQPDVVLMDLLMPDLDGISATQTIHSQQPAIRILVLSSLDEETVVAAVRAGASGYMRKNVSIEVLVQSIRAAAAGNVQFSPAAAARLVQEFHRPVDEPDRPTPRELEVLELVSQGLANKEIGSRLAISEKTVKSHIHSLLGKFGLESRTQAAIYATRVGLVSAGAVRDWNALTRGVDRIPRIVSS